MVPPRFLSLPVSLWCGGVEGGESEVLAWRSMAGEHMLRVRHLFLLTLDGGALAARQIRMTNVGCSGLRL